MRRLAALGLLVLLAACGGEDRPRPLTGATSHPMWDATEAEARRELDLLRDAGADLVRIDVSWAELEPREGERDPAYVQRLDGYAAAARERGLELLVVLIDTPCWAARDPRGCDEGWDPRSKASPPRRLADFAEHAAWVAGRLADDLAAIELWNEPNLPSQTFWRSEDPAAEYAALVRASAPAVREAAPGVPILAGALALADEPFLRAMLRAGVGDAVDAISVHPYTRGRSPREVPPALRRMRELAGMPVWVTEAGVSSCPVREGPPCAGQDGQREYLQELLALDLDTPALVLYATRDKDEAGNEGGFGLVQRDFTPKPALDVARAAWRR